MCMDRLWTAAQECHRRLLSADWWPLAATCRPLVHQGGTHRNASCRHREKTAPLHRQIRHSNSLRCGSAKVSSFPSLHRIAFAGLFLNTRSLILVQGIVHPYRGLVTAMVHRSRGGYQHLSSYRDRSIYTHNPPHIYIRVPHWLKYVRVYAWYEKCLRGLRKMHLVCHKMYV